MSEFKPKKDDNHAVEDAGHKNKTGDSPKPHGDKLKYAVDVASESPPKKR
jgi:hypothetical protein